ncbi:class I SAM-dependent methyltransferase [Knoellia sp. CPCC 206450]|uniref:class I SAM-dependent methyltransferase n=1 Tax=Knoellia tibetensis TaxID=3404798 RepID=UPI003B42E2EE
MSTTTTTDQTQPPPTAYDDAALKARHRAMWALGDYSAVASEVIAPLGPIVVEAAGIGPGQRVHDVAAGSGNVALPAARTGAEVVATDLTPELLERGRQAAEAEGLTVKWVAADAEHLPCDDGEFDTVVSCVGVMFAPHHEAVADQLVRVVRPGGTITLLSWTPEGFIGQMFAAMKPYAPPPPPGAQPPPLWGHVDHVRGLFGDRVRIESAVQQDLVVDLFATPRDFVDFFKANYGPTIAVYRHIAENPERVAALDADLVALAERFDRGTGSTVLDWEYLLLTATRT